MIRKVRPNEAVTETIAETIELLAMIAAFAKCVWTPDSDGTYETSCGKTFVFTDGGPRENGARFCLYCGHPLTTPCEAQTPAGEAGANSECNSRDGDQPLDPESLRMYLEERALIQQAEEAGDPIVQMTRLRADGPGFWMAETSGGLQAALEAYLNHRPMTVEQVAAMRAYLRQWINSDDWHGPMIRRLRDNIDDLTTREAISRWLHVAADEGIDPL